MFIFRVAEGHGKSAGVKLNATGHSGGTPHSCGSEPAPFNLLPVENQLNRSS
jgi:hypothetical protein